MHQKLQKAAQKSEKQQKIAAATAKNKNGWKQEETAGKYLPTLQMETMCVHKNNIVINGNPPCKWFTHLTNKSNIGKLSFHRNHGAL